MSKYADKLEKLGKPKDDEDVIALANMIHEVKSNFILSCLSIGSKTSDANNLTFFSVSEESAKQFGANNKEIFLVILMTTIHSICEAQNWSEKAIVRKINELARKAKKKIYDKEHE